MNVLTECSNQKGWFVNQEILTEPPVILCPSLLDSTSIIASLINLIVSIYKDWNRLMLPENNRNKDSRLSTSVFQQPFNTSTCETGRWVSSCDGDTLEEMDAPVVRLACNLKCLRDQASILCAVHEAVGLEDLKKISHAFRQDIAETCSFVKKYVVVS